MDIHALITTTFQHHNSVSFAYDTFNRHKSNASRCQVFLDPRTLRRAKPVALICRLLWVDIPEARNWRTVTNLRKHPFPLVLLLPELLYLLRSHVRIAKTMAKIGYSVEHTTIMLIR